MGRGGIFKFIGGGYISFSQVLEGVHINVTNISNQFLFSLVFYGGLITKIEALRTSIPLLDILGAVHRIYAYFRGEMYIQKITCNISNFPPSRFC